MRLEPDAGWQLACEDGARVAARERFAGSR